METLGRLKTIVASLENGLELGDVPETLQWCIETIERLQKEQGQEASKLRGAHDAMEALSKALTKTEQERDAALAEVERLKGLANARETRIKHLEGELRGVYSEMEAK